MNNVTQQVQRALHAYLVEEGLTFVDAFQIYTSLLRETATVPNVLIKCQRAICTVSDEGSWRARARIELRESHDDSTETEHFDHAGELFGQFFTETIADDLSQALGDWTAFQVTKVEQGWQIDGRLWVSYLEIDIDCCTSDIG